MRHYAGFLQIRSHIRKTMGDEATSYGILRADLVRNGLMHENINAALYHVCTCFVRWFSFYI